MDIKTIKKKRHFSQIASKYTIKCIHPLYNLNFDFLFDPYCVCAQDVNTESASPCLARIAALCPLQTACSSLIQDVVKMWAQQSLILWCSPISSCLLSCFLILPSPPHLCWIFKFCFTCYDDIKLSLKCENMEMEVITWLLTKMSNAWFYFSFQEILLIIVSQSNAFIHSFHY